MTWKQEITFARTHNLPTLSAGLWLVDPSPILALGHPCRASTGHKFSALRRQGRGSHPSLSSLPRGPPRDSLTSYDYGFSLAPGPRDWSDSALLAYHDPVFVALQPLTTSRVPVHSIPADSYKDLEHTKGHLGPLLFRGGETGDRQVRWLPGWT